MRCLLKSNAPTSGINLLVNWAAQRVDHATPNGRELPKVQTRLHSGRRPLEGELLLD